jgi:prepilin-type N-terminal cleavage/methylation domain-containing protein
MRKGFTLLEVILAVFITGVTVLVVFSVFNKGIALIQHNQLKKQAIELASSYLEAETYNGAEIVINNPYPALTVSKNTQRNANISSVEIVISWQDNINNNSSVILTRNYYSGID